MTPPTGQIAVPRGGDVPATPKVRFTSNVIASMAVVTDFICLLLAVPISLFVYDLLVGDLFDASIHSTAAIIAAVNFFLIRLSRDAYSSPMARGGEAHQGGVLDYMIASILVVATIWQLGMLDMFSRGVILAYIASVLMLLYLGTFVLRGAIALLVRAGYIGQRIVIYGADEDVSQRALTLLDVERLPYLSIVGVADGRKTRLGEGAMRVPFLGGLDAVVDLARRGEVDQVLIALPKITQERLDEILADLAEVAIDICLIPRESVELTTQYEMKFIGTVPILALWQRPIRDWHGILKAAEDRGLALIGIALLSPLLIGTALAIRLTSPGPILFKQRRFGFNNVEIEVLKFRSMYVDRGDATGAARTTRNDDRVTSVGRIIRRLSIDELPQLFNVLRGDMSIVGPRPHATHMKVGDAYYFDAVKGYAARHRVKPGITGLAQVRGLRGEIDTIERARQRVEYDRYYIDNWSLALDFRIILETVFKVIWDKDAY
ncbi:MULTISPECIES: undecaprenyl-phosphate glucose phosphotransferase [Sphingomonadales]|uniref:Undecaprenyl-phosphate glucose phosphotransferase n=2 Tax=Edaphosphingomonas TaxID=3423724 RepID=A0A2T4I652_9SPHN|nr:MULTISPECIES: undecaprenyl-phosphate glucose phosphotransferase [Sphingomonas]AGH48392.1 sugar transferase [Sphingomonas sp. MM-1]MDX3883577.1 undecaprenyl-phosphate glucose phosphotransferase [Sphingomonas sp.]OHT20865.1 UDP-glucose:undecaprenyl-phosphate glucose-1-phosphate transferase [Sphingomonas haloaromaticamans]PTD26120.1 undecaprenyl-phosphate glucose phosphotransferase [Sphingomonas fennica]